MMSINTRANVFVSTRATLYAKRCREKTSMAVMMPLFPPDGSSNGTMSICMASSGSIAILDMSIKMG